MLIAFKCFDFENDDFLTKEGIQLILKHIPANKSNRFGLSFNTLTQVGESTQSRTNLYSANIMD